jgi:hypothetical protein
MHQAQPEPEFIIQPKEIFGMATNFRKPAIAASNFRSPLQAETTSGINPEGHHQFASQHGQTLE